METEEIRKKKQYSGLSLDSVRTLSHWATAITDSFARHLGHRRPCYVYTGGCTGAGVAWVRTGVGWWAVGTGYVAVPRALDGVLALSLVQPGLPVPNPGIPSQGHPARNSALRKVSHRTVPPMCLGVQPIRVEYHERGGPA